MIKDDVILGEGVRVFQPDLVNLYGCSIGDHTRIGAFVEIQNGTTIGNMTPRGGRSGGTA